VFQVARMTEIKAMFGQAFLGLISFLEAKANNKCFRSKAKSCLVSVIFFNFKVIFKLKVVW
jgi:hypothetical protein